MKARERHIESVKYIGEVQYDQLLSSYNNRSSSQFLYGKVDMMGRSVAPLNHTAIEVVGSTDQAALNFVSDAFTDFAAEYERLINPIEGIPQLRAQRAYSNPLYLYDEQLDVVMSAIYSRHILPQKNRIKRFDHFLEIVTNALVSYALQVPLTYSKFVKSSLCPIHSSGLVIEVMKGSHDVSGNPAKMKILQSPSFDAFSEMALKHGFVLATHAPWTLVANLNSPKMVRYAQQYIGTRTGYSDIMEKFYYRCRGFDLDKLRGAIEDMYEILLLNESEVTKHGVCKDGTLVQKRVMLQRQPTSVASGLYGEKKWFYFYVKILAAEADLRIPESKLDRLFDNCYSLLIKHGFERSMDYIERKILGTKPDYYR